MHTNVFIHACHTTIPHSLNDLAEFIKVTSSGLSVEVQEGDLLLYNTWGGGGVGDPLTREPERVQADIAAGLATEQAAREHYGVIFKNGALDEEATKKRRAEMAANKENKGLFDFGSDIETLRANCLAETGLQPPVAPPQN